MSWRPEPAVAEHRCEDRHREFREADAAARAAWLEDAVDTSETIAAGRRLDHFEARTGPLVDDLVAAVRAFESFEVTVTVPGGHAAEYLRLELAIRAALAALDEASRS